MGERMGLLRDLPRGALQMAMQLAYFRDQGRFDATYESTMTRLFLHGRTGRCGPSRTSPAPFVRAMLDAQATPTAKLRALQAAAQRHVRSFSEAMAGRGIDRHLFALYVVSVGKALDAPFLKAALSVPWRLSTSQQPQQQTTLWDIKDPANARRVSPGGGFGPVSQRTATAVAASGLGRARAVLPRVLEALLRDDGLGALPCATSSTRSSR